ncbi:MAG: ABC transporter substrate-binding protein [Euzebya sp.]
MQGRITPGTPSQSLSRRQLLKRLGLAGAAISTPMLLAACEGAASPDESTSEPAPGSSEQSGGGDVDRLTWIVNSLVSLDAAKALDQGSKAAQGLVTESLLTLDEDLLMTEWLAESWEEIDPQTYVYRIRSDVMFSDGSPLTVEDVIYSWERHRDPEVESSLNSAFVDVDTMEVTGDNELTVTLTRPAAFWQYVPSYAPIVSRAFGEQVGERLGTPGDDTLIGTGPYVLTDFRADEVVELVRNDNYWGDTPRFREVAIQYIADSQTAQLAMRAQEADGFMFIPVSEAGGWESIDGLRVESAPGLLPAFFAWDLEDELWGDVHVRRAVAHALDREGLVDGLLSGYGEAATSLVPRGQWDGLDIPSERVEEIYASLRPYEFDLDLAREELAQSAFPDGFSATLKYADAKPELGRAALNLRENLSQIGVDLTVEEVPLGEEIADVVGHQNIGFRALSFTPELLDPADYISYMLPSEFARPSGFNIPNYINPRVDELIDEQGLTTDVEERAAAIAEVMQIISEDLPYLPLWWEDIAMAISDNYEFVGLSVLFFKKGIWVSDVRPVS